MGHLVHKTSFVPTEVLLTVNSDAEFLPLGRVLGIAECGKIFGLIGVISICSVQLVSRVGFLSLSTSTFRLLCSKGQENVSPGILCNQDNKLRSLSLKSDWDSKFVNLIWSECFAPVAFCWQKTPHF